MKHQSATAVPPLRRQAIDTLLRARQLPVGRDRNDLRQLAIGFHGLASLEEVKDWQSQTVLIGGFLQPSPRRGTVANHDAAIALPQGGKESNLRVSRLLAGGLRNLLGALRLSA